MKMGYVVVDIDGTISKVGPRLKYFKKAGMTDKDWKNFYIGVENDEPIKPIINLVEILSKSYPIAFCTGREEKYRDITLDWIKKHFSDKFRYHYLIMRPLGDMRKDWEVKPDMLGRFGLTTKIVDFIIDDRNKVVKRWRELGYTCLQPALGEL